MFLACKAICILASNCCFSSSSGSNSKKIPKSCKLRLTTSSNVLILYVDIEFCNDDLVSGNSKASATFKLIFSANLSVKNKLDCTICLVATFDALAASFCNPTSVLRSGKLPSLASFSPVTSLIICK